MSEIWWDKNETETFALQEAISSDNLSQVTAAFKQIISSHLSVIAAASTNLSVHPSSFHAVTWVRSSKQTNTWDKLHSEAVRLGWVKKGAFDHLYIGKLQDPNKRQASFHTFGCLAWN